MIRQSLFLGKELAEDDPVFQLKPFNQHMQPPQARLTIVRGAQIGYIFPLGSEIALFGRTEGRMLRDVMASRRHMQIFNDGTDFILEDLDSTNGTYVNGRPITKSVVLGHGDTIRVGETMLIFEIPGNEPAVLGYGAVPQRYADNSQGEATIQIRPVRQQAASMR